MLGGYQILDLRKIDLSRGTSEASITDADALRQLLNIRDHIQKNYDFSKPLQNQLKPVLIRYRDKKVGEKHEVALYGNIEVINVYYKFRIITINEGEQLIINVEFEEKTDEYDNKYWDIKTAKILLTRSQPIFEEITDKDGNKRFIEGDFTPSSIEGVSFSYHKWSLSGSHLMIVLAGVITAETSLSQLLLGQITTLPEWIMNKIYPSGNSEFIVDAKHCDMWTDNTTPVNSRLYVAIAKNNNAIQLATWNSPAWSNLEDTYFRVAFDLLIDNESQD